MTLHTDGSVDAVIHVRRDPGRVHYDTSPFPGSTTYVAVDATSARTIDVVFDGPPGPECGRFVEVETPDGRSCRRGEWVLRPDGYWALRIEDPATLRRELDATKAAIRAYLDDPSDVKALRYVSL